jgi:GH15 family glucan-1,4-alpha-glucosidase
MRDPFPPIGDYGVIGDCRTAALISSRGAIEWLCLPRFDSPSIFAAILDRERGGRFAIGPAGPSSVSRRYLDATNVLETTFTTPSGRLRLTDVMTVASEAEKGSDLWPNHEIVRRVEAIEGDVEVEVIVDPRPDYGRTHPIFRHDTLLGFVCARGAEAIAIRSEIPLHLDHGPGMRGSVRLRAGECRYVSLSYEQRLPLIVPALGDRAALAIDTSIRWWRNWAARCAYDGPHREAVIRSALTLKLLTFAPSGAVVAAPTTSLPEDPGGVRNWDYRYCWLRDASLTLRALFDLDFMIEAEAFLSWMLHATRLTWPELQILYDVYGETRLPEIELDHLGGYEGSRPVRVGNAATGQLQLDTYGEVIDAAAAYVDRGGRLNRATARMLAGLGRPVMARWREPDEGIWEIRADRRHHTLSKAMCWVALDRLIGLAARGELRGPVADWARERDAIRAEIEGRGYHERLDSYVNVLDGEDVDAGLLLLGLHGYADPSSPRMRATCRRVHERLGVNGLLYRYLDEDGLSGREGAFGIASFWGVECRARAGDVEGAAAAFDHVLTFANDLGLFGEEIDPASGAALGNFPQAFTHVGLINAALTLDECRRGRAPQPTRVPEEEKRI